MFLIIRGVQVYTGKFLNVKQAKDGKQYGPYAGVALEAQFWPDSPNHPEFPSTLFSAGRNLSENDHLWF